MGCGCGGSVSSAKKNPVPFRSADKTTSTDGLSTTTWIVLGILLGLAVLIVLYVVFVHRTAPASCVGGMCRR